MLADRLCALTARVEHVAVETGAFIVDDWPRPTGFLRLGGAGRVGSGEYIGFSAELQAAFAAGTWLQAGTHRVGDLDPALDPWIRAAVEGALIDLALRQAGLSVARLAEAPSTARLNRCLSFTADPDPAARAGRIGANNPGIAYKIDVHADWDAATLRSLHAIPVAVLDFKAGGSSALVQRVVAHGPVDAVLEDPPAPTPPERTAVDKALRSPSDVPSDGSVGFINVKAPRMGGFVACLRALQRAGDLGLGAYWGGMFEVGVGRKQARQLASLYTSEAANDLAIVCPREIDARPPGSGQWPTIELASPGFGG